MKTTHRFALLGLVFMMPAVLLIAFSLLRFQIPRLLIHPVAVVGGSMAAVIVNIGVILRRSAPQPDGAGKQSFRGWLGALAANLAVVAFGALVVTIICGYVLLENFWSR